MKPTSRRKFIKNAAILPIGLTVPTIKFEEEKPVVETRAKIKLSLNAWSYNVPLYKYKNGEEEGMSLFDMLEECARLDFDAVDPTGYFFPEYPEVPKTKFINEFKRRAFSLGLEISGTGIRNDFATADADKRKADVELAKRWIEVAAEMGAPVLRVFAGNQPEGHSWNETAKWMTEALVECAEHGEKHGVLIGVQNHGDMLKSADEVLKIMELAQNEWLGTIIDTGFMLTPDPYADIARVIPHAVNWQVKELLDARKGPKINMDKLVSVIKASDYRGYVPIETLPLLNQSNEDYDAYKKVPELLNELRKAL